MIGFRRLPVRARLTAGFAAAIAVILVTIGVVLYVAMAAVLLDEVDTGLRSRADTMTADVASSLHLATPGRGLVETREAFAQLLTRDGSVVEASEGFSQPLLTPEQTRALDHPRFLNRRIPGVAAEARMLAMPVSAESTSYVLVTGSSLSDRSDALRMIRRIFLIGGPIALVLACVAGWVVAGIALRPLERMRRQADAIRVAGRRQTRLSVPDPDDELSRLARTLNAMLERIDDAARSERRFLDNASHELRTPLTVLKTELDLAQSRPRSASELAAVIERASEETDRLVRMADDLLLLARAHEGALWIEREETSLRDLLASSADLFATRAAQTHIDLNVNAPQTSVRLDPRRIRQATDNLLDNALRYARTTIELRGDVDPARVLITVADDGPGLPDAFTDRAFEAFERADRHDGAGLGLAIVRMVADGHDGTVTARNALAGGLAVTLTLPVE